MGAVSQAGATTHALLEALRSRAEARARLTAFDPGWLPHLGDLQRMGIAERIDFAVFSSELGKRKPHPAIFERALEALGVVADDAMFVGYGCTRTCPAPTRSG